MNSGTDKGAGLTAIKTYYNGSTPHVYASGWLIQYDDKISMVVWELNSAVLDTCSTASNFLYSYKVDSQVNSHNYFGTECGSTDATTPCSGWFFRDFAAGDLSYSRPILLAIDDTDDMINQGNGINHSQHIWSFETAGKDGVDNQGVGRHYINVPSDSTVYHMTTIDYYGSNSNSLDSFIVQFNAVQRTDLSSRDKVVLIILDRTETD